MAISIIYDIVILLVIGILFLVDKKVGKVQRPIILTPEDEQTNYTKLIEANHTIKKQEKTIKILEKMVEIERMNHTLENYYDRS